METVRVRNSAHQNDSVEYETNEEIFDEIHTTRYEEFGTREYQYDSRGQPHVTTESVTYRRDINGDLIEETTTTTGLDPSEMNRSSSFVVKLFPSDEQEKEVQEMTMFVESPNGTVTAGHRHF